MTAAFFLLLFIAASVAQTFQSFTVYSLAELRTHFSSTGPSIKRLSVSNLRIDQSITLVGSRFVVLVCTGYPCLSIQNATPNA